MQFININLKIWLQHAGLDGILLPFSPSVPEIKILRVVRSPFPFSPSVPKIKIRRLFQVLAQRDLELRDKKRSLTYLPDVQ